ncbi:MAG TPA: LuxR C-terminal-related transcriptional regulator, partial [Candidatus Cybelea sp.]
VLAASLSDILRLLERDGFDMLERARGDVVARAIESLDEHTRRQNATILALQGALQATAGKFARAESLLRRALAKAGSNRDLFAITSLRLASLVANQGGEIASVLDPVANDRGQSAAHRAEAISLVLAAQALTGETNAVKASIAEIEELLPAIEYDATRARILHHLGIANRRIGEIDRSVLALVRSSDLASDLHLYSVASRAHAVLSNLALHEEDDVGQQLRYAELAADAATKAGDVFALRTSLLQILGAHMRLGDIGKSTMVEQRLASIRADDSARRYLALFRSVRFAWDGRFGEAHRLIASSWPRIHFDFDRVSSGAHFAVFLSLDGRRETSMRVVREVLEIAASVPASGVFRTRSLALSRTLCALAEFANHRFTCGERILRGIAIEDQVARCAVEVVRMIGRAGKPQQQANREMIVENLNALRELGHGDAARLFIAAFERLRWKGDDVRSRPLLTRSQQEVLGLLAAGLVPKEIAIETARSVNTVRVHIANAIERLECHGQRQAVIAARHLGLI